MYHTKFHGTHYEIGYRYGAALRKNGKFILDNIPFPMGREQSAFAASCLPFYETYFPEILLEIKGLADGQQCPVHALETVLFCMYCMIPSCHCSHFAVRSHPQEFQPGSAIQTKSTANILLGRNSDFLTCIEKLYTNSIYHFTGGSFSFTGNTTAFIQMEDGVNEHGLAAGLTMVQSPKVRPGINAGMLLRLLLEKCRNVTEALKLLKKIPSASCHTFVLADREGTIALAECSPAHTEFLVPSGKNAFVCATNLFHTKAMESCNLYNADNWQAQDRYETLVRTLDTRHPAFSLSDGMALLSGKNGFICQYDRKTGKDTVWSVLYDVQNGKIYRAEGNPSRRKFQEDTRFQF